jgi:ATP-dependent Clp protease ATP-binding subunit ClpC
MEHQGIAFEVSEAAINLLTEKGFSAKYGARFLKRHIDEKVKLPLTAMWKTSTNFVVDLEDGEIVVKTVAGTNANLN